MMTGIHGCRLGTSARGLWCGRLAERWLIAPSGESCAKVPGKEPASQCDLAVRHYYRTIRVLDNCADSGTENRRV